MTLLTRLLGARHAIEVGTFTGYSAISIARGLSDDGALLCCDVNEEWTAIARKYWERAGVDDKIELRIAPTIETLAIAPGGGAVSTSRSSTPTSRTTPTTTKQVLARLRPNGVILVDNTLWGGAVADPRGDRRQHQGHPRVQRHGCRRRPRREHHPHHGRRAHPDPETLTRPVSDHSPADAGSEPSRLGQPGHEVADSRSSPSISLDAPSGWRRRRGVVVQRLRRVVGPRLHRAPGRPTRRRGVARRASSSAATTAGTGRTPRPDRALRPPGRRARCR